MSEQITITLPCIDETIHREAVSTHDTKTAAITAIRDKYARLAQYNGNIIKIARRVNDNPSFDDSVYLTDAEGREITGLLVFDSFTTEKTGEEKTGEEWWGRFMGLRLYLTTTGWIEIERLGAWSSYQNSTNVWMCGDVRFGDGSGSKQYFGRVGGHVKPLTDAEVIERYSIGTICETLSKSLKTLSEELPTMLPE